MCPNSDRSRLRKYVMFLAVIHIVQSAIVWVLLAATVIRAVWVLFSIPHPGPEGTIIQFNATEFWNQCILDSAISHGIYIMLVESVWLFLSLELLSGAKNRQWWRCHSWFIYQVILIVFVSLTFPLNLAMTPMGTWFWIQLFLTPIGVGFLIHGALVVRKVIVEEPRVLEPVI